MSRAMNLSLPEADVVARCAKMGVAISAIEVLPAGGTHLVTVTSEGAKTMRDLLGKHLIAGRVSRFGYLYAPQPQRRDPPTSPAGSTSIWQKPPAR